MKLVTGFDLGKEGGDMSVLTIGYGENGVLHVCAVVKGTDAEKLYAAMQPSEPCRDADVTDAITHLINIYNSKESWKNASDRANVLIKYIRALEKEIGKATE